MEIFYCKKCRLCFTNHDMEKGKAIEHENSVYCLEYSNDLGIGAQVLKKPQTPVLRKVDSHVRKRQSHLPFKIIRQGRL